MSKTIFKLIIKFLQFVAVGLSTIGLFYWIFGQAILSDDMSRMFIVVAVLCAGVISHLATTQEIDEWFDEHFKKGASHE
ncbi:hypothetical protein R4467_02130 [Acinetobacter baumannii]|nr:hypothetical protein [Acinetobacter baumannii]